MTRGNNNIDTSFSNFLKPSPRESPRQLKTPRRHEIWSTDVQVRQVNRSEANSYRIYYARQLLRRFVKLTRLDAWCARKRSVILTARSTGRDAVGDVCLPKKKKLVLVPKKNVDYGLMSHDISRHESVFENVLFKFELNNSFRVVIQLNRGWSVWWCSQ